METSPKEVEISYCSS